MIKLKDILEAKSPKAIGDDEIHVVTHGTKYKIHAVGKTFGVTKDNPHGLAVGHHINDTEYEDLQDSGAKIKHIKEDVEQVDELKKSTLGSYIIKAGHDRDSKRTQSAYSSGTDYDKQVKTISNRAAGVRKAVARLTKEEVEQIAEGKQDPAVTKAVQKQDPDVYHINTVGSEHVYGGGQEGRGNQTYHVHNTETGKTHTISLEHGGEVMSRADIRKETPKEVSDKAVAAIHKDHKEEVGDMHESYDLQEGVEAHAQFQQYHNDSAKLLKGIGGALSKHYDNVTNKKGWTGGQANWNHVAEIKGAHRQLQDLHDAILQVGEYHKPAEVKKLKEEVEPEADMNILVQLRKPIDILEHGTQGGADVVFGDGQKVFVEGTVAKKLVESMEKIKPEDRVKVAEFLYQSHDNMMAVYARLK